MLRDIFAGRQSVYKLFIEFPAGYVIDINDSSVCLVKAGVLDQPFDAVALAVAVLDIDEHPETILKGDILHLGIILLGDKGI